MSELYLICHKVRGQPAFDIAERMPELDEDGELGWIIPTSGHRAHPVATWKLEDLADVSDYPHQRPDEAIEKLDFGAAPDHYPTALEPRRSPVAGTTLLQRLGLLRKAEPIKRRV